MLLAVHLLLVGAWIGTVLVEVLFERALLGQGRAQELLLARLHWKVDLLVELPLLVAVVATGAKLLSAAPLAGAFKVKLVFALLAVVANFYCIVLVRIRLKAAEAEAWDIFALVDRRQHLVGAVVLIALLMSALVAIAT